MSFQTIINITFSKAKENFLRFLPLYFIVYATDLLALENEYIMIEKTINILESFTTISVGCYIINILVNDKESTSMKVKFKDKLLLFIKYSFTFAGVTMLVMFLFVGVVKHFNMLGDSKLFFDMESPLLIEGLPYITTIFIILSMTFIIHIYHFRFSLTEFIQDVSKLIKVHISFAPYISRFVFWISIMYFFIGIMMSFFEIPNKILDFILFLQILTSSIAFMVLCAGQIVFLPVLFSEDKILPVYQYVQKSFDLVKGKLIKILILYMFIIFLIVTAETVTEFIIEMLIGEIKLVEYFIEKTFEYLWIVYCSCFTYSLFIVLKSDQNSEDELQR